LLALAASFVKLGAIAFGGPAAHVAMIEQEVVARRGWVTQQEFLDFLGLSNLIPGPTSTEMAIYIGQRRRGWAGLLVAGAAFILPSTIMVAALAWAYVRYRSLPQIAGVLYGVKPVVIAVIVQAVFRLSRTALKSAWLVPLWAAASVAAAVGVNGLLIFVLAGLLTAVIFSVRTGRSGQSALLFAGGGVAGASAAAPFGLKTLFLVFFKIGAILFGGGYVLVAFLRSNLVQGLGWITERQLLDAVAVGQVTPGPISTAATFLGFILGGFSGAAVATVAIFLPAFLLVAFTGPFVSKIRSSPLAAAVLDGINVAALAIIVVVTWQLGRAAIVDWTTLVIAVVSGLLLIRWRVNSAWLVAAGAAAGAVAQAIH
jgi:chromate transporter